MVCAEKGEVDRTDPEPEALGLEAKNALEEAPDSPVVTSVIVDARVRSVVVET
jgi:hypothetical protein